MFTQELINCIFFLSWSGFLMFTSSLTTTLFVFYSLIFSSFARIAWQFYLPKSWRSSEWSFLVYRIPIGSCIESQVESGQAELLLPLPLDYVFHFALQPNYFVSDKLTQWYFQNESFHSFLCRNQSRFFFLRVSPCFASNIAGKTVLLKMLVQSVLSSFLMGMTFIVDNAFHSGFNLSPHTHTHTHTCYIARYEYAKQTYSYRYAKRS